MTHDTLGQQGYGQPQDWDADVFYPVRQSVLYQGGIWRAQAGNLNSAPISGNTNWMLVAGPPYVDVTVTPPDFVSAPFFSSPLSAPGFPVIPAPGAGLYVLPVGQVTMTVSDGDQWGATPTLKLYWVDPTETGTQPFGAANLSTDSLRGAHTTKNRFSVGPIWDNDMSFADDDFPPDLDNAAVVMQTATDMTSGGTVFGTRSATFRIYYLILPVKTTTTAAFYHITAVDQGLKTFTVSPDPTSAISAGNTVSVVGSTGLNNGTYTVASATATTVVVNEAIPDSTADGWVEVDA